MHGFNESELVDRSYRVRNEPDFMRQLQLAATTSEPVYPPSNHVELQIYTNRLN